MDPHASGLLKAHAGSNIFPSRLEQDIRGRGLRRARAFCAGSKTSALQGSALTHLLSWVSSLGTNSGKTIKKKKWCDNICHTITKRTKKIGTKK